MESPETEQTFPGLYGYDTGKKSNESDLSGDDSRPSKKELLIGKRKEKDSKKDRGYAALEGESSPEEETKSPVKSKKSKSFKFASSKSKEKREKSREKDRDAKEKDTVDKKKEKDKDKKVEKLKEKPKSDKKEKRKHGPDDGADIGDELPIFRVSLELAVERYRCHDGVDLPLPVRECIDYVQEHGMTIENVYKLNYVKSKVNQLKHLYNNRLKVNWSDYDVASATGLLKTFIREIPSPILTNELLPKFEEASAIQNTTNRKIEIISLIQQLPPCNRSILTWLMLHLDTVIEHEKVTKMNVQVIAATFSPILLISQRLISVFLYHCKSLFPDTVLTKYVPPLTSNAVTDLEDIEQISIELKKQESLLSQIHIEMNAGFITKEREELLWDVQRVITQLKRKLRATQKCHDVVQNQEILDETCTVNPITVECNTTSVQIEAVESTSGNELEANKQSTSICLPSMPIPLKEKKDNGTDSLKSIEPNGTVSISQKENVSSEEQKLEQNQDISVQAIEVPEQVTATNCEAVQTTQVIRPLLSEEDKNILLLQFQNSELIELQTYLLSQIQVEKNEIAHLKTLLTEFDKHTEFTDYANSEMYNVEWDKLVDLLVTENRILQIKKNSLVREIMEEREECVNLQSQLLYIALSQG